MLHTKFHQNRILNKDFKNFGVGLKEMEPLLHYLLIFNIHIMMFHTKFHKNQILNENFNILDGGEDDPICENFQFYPNFNN